MFFCDRCPKSFDTSAALRGHCRIHGSSEGGYSKSRKTGRNTIDFMCLNCEVISSLYESQSRHKFCSRICQSEYIWKTEGIVEVLSGVCKNKKRLKRYLRETFGDVCSTCSQPPYHNGKPLTLQMDHIDGNSDNNDPNNLRLLCPNCHTQTETYGSKGNKFGTVKDTSRNRYLRKYQKVA